MCLILHVLIKFAVAEATKRSKYVGLQYIQYKSTVNIKCCAVGNVLHQSEKCHDLFFRATSYVYFVLLIIFFTNFK